MFYRAPKNIKYFLLFILIFFSCANKNLTPATIITDHKKITFNVEIADTEEKRAQGLMNRKQLNPNEGMLFVFDTPERQSFWMKDTFIPLDLIFIDKEKKIVFIYESANPLSERIISPLVESLYVLEIAGGTSKNLGLSVGNSLVL